MSEPNAQDQGPSNTYTLFFTIALCSLCALILAALASGLKDDQQRALELDRNKQMLIAAHLLNHQNVLQIQTAPGIWQDAQMGPDGELTAVNSAPPATAEQINQLFKTRIHPMFTDRQGQLYSPKELNIDPDRFFAQNQKTGFAHLAHKLIYVILAPNSKDPKNDPASGYIIPVNGFGLWGPIYGYIAIDKDAKTVLGISWYQHGETPGLGANIAEASWQKQFPGKSIFQKDRSGNVNYDVSPVGVVVIKGKVSEVYGDDPRGQSAVDGMTGATITGNGVTRAYKEILEEYRPFLLAMMKKQESQSQ